MTTDSPTVHEARIAVLQRISDLLYDLSDGEEMTPAEADEFRAAMGDAAEIILEVLDFKVVSVDGDVVTASVWIGTEAPPNLIDF